MFQRRVDVRSSYESDENHWYVDDSSKRQVVKKLLHQQACPDVVLIQEIKFQKIDRGLIKFLDFRTD